jgi:hypothetical protein
MKRHIALLLLGVFAVILIPRESFAAGNIAHRILSRRDWGADESLLVGNSDPEPDAVASGGDNGSTTGQSSSTREQECKDAYKRYPEEFKASTPVTRNANGETLRWPQQFSSQVKLLVVHHTAIAVKGDSRSGIEKMRALYEFHAKNRGWGDVGYHYIIDENGQIYEGRAGGDFVVGGHVYCNNVGTVGIAMMGNFEIEQPTQSQVQSLQWLLQTLAQKYRIDLGRNVLFHGKSLPPVVGHGQLISTDCPGLVVSSVMDQIRTHVRAGDVDTAVEFPQIESPVITEEEKKSIVTGNDGLATLGETVIEGRPGGMAGERGSIRTGAGRSAHSGTARQGGGIGGAAGESETSDDAGHVGAQNRLSQLHLRRNGQAGTHAAAGEHRQGSDAAAGKQRSRAADQNIDRAAGDPRFQDQ